ncbi:MAG: ArnT family glycosyltransferase [Pleurocapsa sp.]
MPLRKSLTYDEPYYYNSGLAILSGNSSIRGADNVNERNIMPFSALNAIVGGAVPKSIVTKIAGTDPNKMHYSRIYFGRLVTIFASMLLAILVFIWSQQLYGTLAAFLSLIIYILDPNIIAHSRLVTQDLFGALTVFLATYCFWLYLKFGDRKNAVLSMVTFGLAQIARYTAIYLAPNYLILTLGFYSSALIKLIKTRKFKPILSGIKQGISYSVLLAMTAILIINIGFSGERTFTKFGEYKFSSQALSSLQECSSLLRAIPVPIPYTYLRGLDFGKYKQETGFGGGITYLNGELGIENGKPKGFKEYYLLTLLYKVPIATQIFIVLAIFSLIKYRNQIQFWQNEAFLIVPPVFYIATFSLANAQIGVRYILMIFPFLFVLVGRLARSWNPRQKLYRIGTIALISYLAISNFSYFPHYISYFNEILLNRKLNYTLLADSNVDWGQNMMYIKRYLLQHPEVTKATSGIYGDMGLPPERIFDASNPQPGLMAIEVNDLVGITTKPEQFQWIEENLKPQASVGYNYLIFDIKPEHLQSMLNSK